MDTVLTLDLDDNHIATLNINNMAGGLNILSFEVLEALEEIIETLHQQRDLALLIIKSSTPNCFIAGADINEIKMIDSEEEAYEKVRQGQHIFSKLEALPYPTLAVIDGACLGGGFELALACQFRLTTENPKTLIGLPEVNLGVLPGFGGTQRLKCLIGVQKALELILGSKLLKGPKALKLGLVDACVPQGYLDFKIAAMTQEILEHKGAMYLKKRHKKSLVERFIPQIIFHYGRQNVLKLTKGNYPAPLEVLDLFEATQKLSLSEGLELEARAFSRLAISDVSKYLIGLFFTSELLKKSHFKTSEMISIDKIGVIGGGVMGSGIVWLFSNMNRRVRALIRREQQIAKMIQHVHSIYKRIQKRKRLTQREVSQKIAHISYTTQLIGFNRFNLILEAIAENVPIKQEMYAAIEAQVSPEAIIATNTSSLSINLLSSQMKHPERFIGMHFFNPVNKMPLVEVIASEKSSQATINTVVKLAQDAGKIPVVVADCAGFLVNRILLTYMNESLRMFEEGGDVIYIDRIVSDFGMPMGPFTLADEVGLDVGYKVAKVLETAYGERAKVSTIFETISVKMKLLGKKDKKGFYIHTAQTKTLNPDVSALQGTLTDFDTKEIIERTMLVMINEAALCLKEGVVKSAAELDIAMIMGTGFPPFRGGLLHYADTLGIHNIVVTLNRLKGLYGDRFEPAPLLIEMDQSNQRFYEE